jgi:hypothetical protein
LERFGNIVVVYLFAYFINSEKIVAIFTQIPLFVVDNAAFYDVVILALWA